MTTSVAAPRDSFLSYSHTIGLLVMSGRGFQYPIDAAEGKDGRLYVPNRTSGYGEGVQITMCDTDSAYFGAFGSGGGGDGQFTLMSSIATDGEGLVYVSDDYLCRVSVFDPDGGFLETWGEPGSGLGQMDGPSGLAFDRDDNLYVVDQRNNRVQKFTKGAASWARSAPGVQTMGSSTCHGESVCRRVATCTWPTGATTGSRGSPRMAST